MDTREPLVLVFASLLGRPLCAEKEQRHARVANHERPCRSELQGRVTKRPLVECISPQAESNAAIADHAAALRQRSSITPTTAAASTVAVTRNPCSIAKAPAIHGSVFWNSPTSDSLNGPAFHQATEVLETF